MPFLPSLDHADKVPHVLAKFDTGTGRPLHRVSAERCCGASAPVHGPRAAN